MQLTFVPLQGSVQLVAKLTDSAGNPLPNKPIEFYVSKDGTNWTLVGTVNTDSTGTAIYVANVYNWYMAKFPGDEQYLSSLAVVQYAVTTCCSFIDIACWFFQKDKCVQIFGYTIDGLTLSIILVVIIVIIILLFLK